MELLDFLSTKLIWYYVKTRVYDVFECITTGLPVYNVVTYSELLQTFSLYNGYSRYRVRHSHKRRASMREYKQYKNKSVCTSRTVNKYQLFC